MAKPKKLNDLEVQQFLDEAQWRRVAVDAMRKIKSGQLATYGRIAQMVEKEIGHNPGARSIAWLRWRLYAFLHHATTEVPLHRIAKAGDISSSADSKKTRDENNKRRSAEGSLVNPQWI